MRTRDHSVDAAALRLLRSQHGYAAVGQLYDLGMSKDQIARRVRHGVLRRCGYGLVSFDPPERTPEASAMRAVLSAGEGAVVCRWTAAELHGIEVPRSNQVHVLIAGDRRQRRRDAIVLHRTRHLPEEHMTVVRGVPATSVPRTLADCATELDRWRTLRALDSVSADAALRRAIHETADLLSNGRALVRTLADVTAPDGEQHFRSVLERKAAEALSTHGIQNGEWNVPIYDGRGRVREVDLCFRHERLIVEFDGLRFHRTPGQARRDRATDRRLALAGWRVLRFTWTDVVHRPSEVAEQIATALDLA